jgi:hypothetical protein
MSGLASKLIRRRRGPRIVRPNEVNQKGRNSIHLHYAIPLALGIVPHLRRRGRKASQVVQPMTLMSIGLYNEPAGAWFPSILF